MQLAPFLLILILLALGAYALLTLRDNQRKLDALMAGPVRQAELAADLNSTIWAAHAKLYRLAATAANEADSNKILAMAKEASAASAKILDAVKALEDFQADEAAKSPTLQKLRAAATSYLKQSKNAIEMADGDAGSAMMFIKGAERPFAEIDKLTDELGVQSTDARDREIARSSVGLEQQQRMLGMIILVVTLIGFGISFRIGRGISKPVVAMASAMRELAGGRFDLRLPGLERADEVGQMARAVDEFKAQAIAKAEREAAEREQRSRELSERQQEELHRLADKFEAAVGEIIETVSRASNDLETAAQDLTKNTETTRELSVKVSAASAETSSNVQSVASATEEMASSVSEISRQVQRIQSRCFRGGRSGATDRWPDHHAVRGCRSHRRCHQADHDNCRADQPARAERHHRGGARWRCRPRFCGGCPGSQSARQPDREGNRRNRLADHRDPGRDEGFRRRHQANRRHDRTGVGDRGDHCRSH